MSPTNAFGEAGGFGAGAAFAPAKDTTVTASDTKSSSKSSNKSSNNDAGGSVETHTTLDTQVDTRVDSNIDTNVDARVDTKIGANGSMNGSVSSEGATAEQTQSTGNGSPSSESPSSASPSSESQAYDSPSDAERGVNWARVAEEYRHKAPIAAVSLALRPAFVIRAFGVLVIPLFFAGFLVACLTAFTEQGYGSGVTGLFSLDRALNFVSWLGSVCFFSCAVLLALLAAVAKACRDPLYKDWRPLSWIVLLISADQVCHFREPLLALPHKFVSFSTNLDFVWLVLAAVLLALRFKVFMRCLPRDTRKRLVLGSVLYFCGLLGMVFIGKLRGQAAFLGGPYQASTLIDETLEMAGLLLFLRALLDHVAEYAPRFGLHFDRR